MIDPRSLKLSVYEFLERCTNTPVQLRAVGVITDKQSVFYSQILRNDYRTHDNIVIDLEDAIHPNDVRKSWSAIRDNNVHFFCQGTRTFLVDLPQDQRLSMSQVSLLERVLKEVDKFNNECDDERYKVKVEFFSSKQNDKISNLHDASEIIKELRNMVTKKYRVDDEEIIGHTLSSEEISKNLVYHVGYDKCKTLDDFISLIFICDTYYEDSYYRVVFKDIFPNYKRVKDLALFVNSLNLDSINISGVSFTELGDYLLNIINNYFATKSFEEIKDSVFDYGNYYAKSVLPNYVLMSKYIRDIYEEEDYKILDELLKGSNSYDDFMKIVINYCYNKKNQELTNYGLELDKLDKELDKAKKVSEIGKNKDELASIIDKVNKLNSDIREKEVKLSIMDIYGDEGKEKKSLEDAISLLNKEYSLLEKKFMDISGLDYIPYDASSLDLYTEDLYSVDSYLAVIKIRKDSINNLKKEIIILEQSGLISKDDVHDENKGFSK